MAKLQLKFKRGENLKYCSHLDLLRMFTRLVRRSGIPLKYSEGFNPHPKITFALPLSVGVTSEGEYLQLDLEREINLISGLKKLSEQCPRGFEIIEGRLTDRKLPPITKARYRLNIELSEKFTQEQERMIGDALRGSELIVKKVTKKKESSVNILEHIHSFNIEAHHNSEIIIKTTLSAGSEFNLNPLLLVEGLKSNVEGFLPLNIEIHREELLFD